LEKQPIRFVKCGSSRFTRLALLVAALMVIAGCGGGAPPPSAQLNVEEIATWYNMYRAKHNRQPPPNEEAFVAFINKTMKEDQGITEGMREDFLISPRDGKKFVVNYGKPMSTNPDKNIVVYEQEGAGGKKWFATEMGYGQEVDDDQLKQLLAAK
jgi:hypothetical protein